MKRVGTIPIRDRRGSVALMTAVMLPVMIMTLAMGIEITYWSVVKLELQRVADVAAWAGAAQYVGTASGSSATGAAADVAEINGIQSATARTWNAATKTTTDNMITAQMVSGPRNAADVAVKVTVQRNISKSFSRIFPSLEPSVTVSAFAVAEITPVGAQPCILALAGYETGITTEIDITVGGNASLTASGCSMRSNGGIRTNGGATITASGVYAGGTISGSGICCGLYPNAGQSSDPYANNAAVQGALAQLSPGSGTAVSVGNKATRTISPGTSAGWDVKGTLTLNPGLYLVNGDISTGAQGLITGTGVTIVTSGALNASGGAGMNLTAATTSTTSNAIPGVLFAGKSSAAMAFVGNSTFAVTGLLYFPNASLKFAGTSDSGGSGCTEVIAGTVTLVGTSNVSANCSNYGLQSFSPLTIVGLVQ